MKFTTSLLAVALASIAPLATAQTTTELSITGNIFPGACNVVLGNEGIADLGTINTRDLNENSVTDLPPVTLPLTVACGSAVRFAFQGVDNTNSTDAVGRYGLGLTPENEKIGDAQVNLLAVTLDGDEGYKTNSADNGQTWTVSGAGIHHDISPAHLRGYAKEAGVTTGPAPTAALQGTLEVKARISPANTLTLDNDVQIAGNVALVLFYQ